MMTDLVKRRSVLNLLTGIAYQIINTLLGLVLPYLFITSFGSETNGLLSSIAQLFTYLSLLEGGISVASMQALYRPIAHDDKAAISSIISATANYFYRTGLIYAAGVVLLAVVYPLAIDTSLSPLSVFLLVLLQGIGNVFSYLVQGKYTPLFRAEGRLYVTHTLSMVFSVLRNAAKIIAIAAGCNVIVVQALHCILMILYSLLVWGYVKKKYHWLDKRARPNDEALSQKNSLFAQHIAWVLFNHVDVLILTVITKDLALVSVYSVYLIVFEAIQNVVDTVGNGLQHKMGQSGQESKRALCTYYSRFERNYIALAFALFCVTYLLARPFISLYVGDVEDANYLMPWVAELFLIVKVLNAVRLSNRKLIEVVGHFRETKNIIYGEMVLNLGVSFFLAPSMGIYGVLLGTIVALVYSVVAHIWYVNRKVLSKSVWTTGINLLLNTALTLMVCGNGRSIIEMSESYFGLILQAIIVTIVVGTLFVLLVMLEGKLNIGRIDEQNS